MDLDRFLDIQVNKLNATSFDDYNIMDEEDLYDDIDSEHGDMLQIIFTMLHHNFNKLFTSINYSSRKSRQGESAFHVTAGESRHLINCISIFKDTNKHLSNTEEAFYLNEDYIKQIEFVNKYLRSSYGSDIPFEEYDELEIEEYEPIFKFQNVFVKNSSITSDKSVNLPLKPIGEGSYASAFKYKDDFYNKNFVLKRAKKGLNEREIERFKQEYAIMKSFKSPYVVNVYKMSQEPLEYVMDYGDISLNKFIRKNPQLSIINRKKIVTQLFAGFEYIHSKKILHRDISPDNVLLDLYDDDVYVVKLCDFGLAKNPDNHLTSVNTEFKGWFNDPSLRTRGFSNYGMPHEIYALTTLIFFVMTGRENIDRIPNDSESIRKFIDGGTNIDLNKRYDSVTELRKQFKITGW